MSAPVCGPHRRLRLFGMPLLFLGRSVAPSKAKFSTALRGLWKSWAVFHTAEVDIPPVTANTAVTSQNRQRFRGGRLWPPLFFSEAVKSGKGAHLKVAKARRYRRLAFAEGVGNADAEAEATLRRRVQVRAKEINISARAPMIGEGIVDAASEHP